MRISDIMTAIAISSLIALSLSTEAIAKDGTLINLPDRRFAVLSVGDLEKCINWQLFHRCFKDKDLTEFETGRVFARDGSVFDDSNKPRIVFADINNDGSKELVVSKLSAGSGNYLEVDALQITDKNVKLLARINIKGKNDPVKSLRALCKREQCVEQKRQ